MTKYERFAQKVSIVRLAHYKLTRIEGIEKVFSYPEFQRTIDKYLNKELFNNPKKIELLNKFIHDVKIINEIFKPLHNIGFSYNLDITGGAVRDFIFLKDGKPKDLDLMIKIEPEYNNYDELILDYFTPKELKKSKLRFNLPFSENREQYTVEIIKLLLGRYKNLKKPNYITTKQIKHWVSHYGGLFEDNGSENKLYGVLKFEDKKLNFPIDILITGLSKNIFLDLVDFGICQCSFCLISPYYQKNIPEDTEEFISRFIATPMFWNDIRHKRITIDTTENSIRLIERAIGEHYERIKEKFPKFKLQICGKKKNETELIHKNNEIKREYYKFNNKLKINTAITKINKTII